MLLCDLFKSLILSVVAWSRKTSNISKEIKVTISWKRRTRSRFARPSPRLYCRTYYAGNKSANIFLTEEILYNISAVSDLLGRHYHLTPVNFCALRKYFFHMGRKPEINLDYTANVCRELQGLYREIGVQGFQIYGDCMYTCNPCNFEISTV